MKVSKTARKAFAAIGRIGAAARTAALSPAERSAIAKHAAQTRWKGHKKMKAVMAALLLLALAHPAQAQSQKRIDWPSVIAASVAASADTISTTHGLSGGKCHEANPLLDRHPSTQTLWVSTGIMAIGLVSLNALAEHAGSKPWRWISRGLNWYVAGMETTMTVNNLRVCS